MTSQRRDPAPLGRPGGAGTDPDALGLGVDLIRTATGRGLAVPRSVARLSPPAMDLVAQMQEVALQRAELYDQLTEMVVHARDHDISWGAIAWSVGTTAEGARQRWGLDDRA